MLKLVAVHLAPTLPPFALSAFFPCTLTGRQLPLSPPPPPPPSPPPSPHPLHLSACSPNPFGYKHSPSNPAFCILPTYSSVSLVPLLLAVLLLYACATNRLRRLVSFCFVRLNRRCHEGSRSPPRGSSCLLQHDALFAASASLSLLASSSSALLHPPFRTSQPRKRTTSLSTFIPSSDEFAHQLCAL